MVKFIVSGILVAILAFVINLTIYLGVFRQVDIEIAQEPEMQLVTQPHLGAYHKIVNKIEEVESWAKSNKVDCHLSIGLYLDNPDVVEEERLKSFGGCVVHRGPGFQPEQLPRPLPENFQVQTLPAQRYIKATFTGSPSIGPIKVYPKVKKFAEDQRLILGPVVYEIYELLGSDKNPNKMMTTYLFSLDKEPSK